jgi:Tfp pilus assembly protein PilF/tRNA A-37 threonylcarbamoyl transferase component Bud32
MVFRVHTPDKKVGADGLPITVLPDGHMLYEKYTVTYFTAGGMATIYKAKSESKTFIIKEVDRTNGQAVIALNAEKAMLERLDHPGIVKLEEIFEAGGYFYLVTEYIDGENLLKKLPRSTTVFLSEKVVLDWTRQLLDIFDYLHSQRPPVIYRDLKPQNVIHNVTTGRIVLIDFGIARIYKEFKKEDTARMGSVITASPEHYGDGQTDIRSDIYTIGATMYMLLSNNVTWREEIFKFPPLRQINPKVSERTAAVVEKALQLRPSDRYQNIAEMRAALFAISDMEDASDSTAHGGESAADSQAHPAREHGERERGVARASLAGESKTPHRKICSYCRRKNSYNAQTCEFCGQPMIDAGRESLADTRGRNGVLDEKTVNLRYRMGFSGISRLVELVRSINPKSLSKILMLAGAVALMGLLSAHALLTWIMSPPSHRGGDAPPSQGASSAGASSGSPATPLAVIDTGAKPTRSIISSGPGSMSPTGTSASAIPSPTPVSSGPASPSPGVSPSAEPSYSSDKVKRLFEKGVDAFRDGRHRDAEDCFRKVISLDRGNAEACWYLGQTLEAEDRSREALKYYRQYAVSSSTDPEKLRHIARMMMSMKDNKAALPLLMKAQTQNRTADGFFSLGSCYYNIGDYEKAVWALRGSLALQKNHLASVLLIAECHDRRGNYGDAFQAYRSAWHMKPGQIELLFSMARMADKMGDYATSKECLKRYLALEGDEGARAEALKMLEEEKVKALKVIPPSVERQRDFIPGVTVMGIFGSGSNYVAHLNVRGSILEIKTGDRFLSRYYVLSINAERIVLARDESHVVLRP